MNVRDVTSGLFWLTISVLVCIESTRSGVGTINVPGPGFLPFWAAVVLGTFGIILVGTALLNKGQGRRGILELWKGVAWGKAVFVLVCLVIYALLLQRVGYLIMTFGLMVLLYSAIERPKPWVLFVIAFLTAVSTYVVFYAWLNVQLPKGVVEF